MVGCSGCPTIFVTGKRAGPGVIHRLAAVFTVAAPWRHLVPQQREDADKEGGAHNQRWSEHGQVLHGLTLLPAGSAAACAAARNGARPRTSTPAAGAVR
jgi:hypothetical protein